MTLIKENPLAREITKKKKLSYFITIKYTSDFGNQTI